MTDILQGNRPELFLKFVFWDSKVKSPHQSDSEKKRTRKELNFRSFTYKNRANFETLP